MSHLRKRKANLPSVDELKMLERAVAREKVARQNAEDLLENMASEILEANEKLKTQYQELDFLRQVSLIAEEELRTSEFVRRFLRLSADFLGWPLGHVYFNSRDASNCLRSSRIWVGDISGEFAEFRRVTETTEFEWGEGLPGRVAQANQVSWIEDIKNDDNFPRASQLKSLSLRTCFGVPLSLHGKVLAVFEFFNTEVVAFSEHQSKIIHSGLKQLSLLMERKQTQQALAENYRNLKVAKEQLVQSEKMASLGIMSAGVAHEINNPLSYVISNLESLKDYLARLAAYELESLPFLGEHLRSKRVEYDIDYIHADMRPLLEETLSGIFRVRDIVSGLKAFSHLDQTQRGEVDLNECIRSALKILANELRYSCELKLNLSDLPVIEGFSGQIVQVFTNLILNAMQAMEQRKGVLTIESRVGEVGTLHVTVQDTGRGIASKHLSQIFTPFFTTKKTGKGTGLGLSISYGIVKAHQGDIQVRSQVGVGTVIELIFSRPSEVASVGEQESEYEW